MLEARSREQKLSLSLFTLQGLGNSILALPAVLILRKYFELTLFLMNAAGVHFYRMLDPGLRIEMFESSRDILTRKMERCDVAATLYPNWKRELAALARIPAARKVSFSDRDYLLSRIPYKEKIDREPVHDLENNFRMLERLGIREKFPEILPHFLTEGETAEKSGKQAVLHPTASSASKFYPREFWIWTVEYLRSRGYGIQIFSGPAPGEDEYCRDILRALAPSPQLTYGAGRPLREVARAIAGAGLFIGLDSALMHLAALLDCRTIALWSFADFRRIYPYGNDAHVYLPRETAKRKGYFFGYPSGVLSCLKRADAKKIFEIIESDRGEDFTITPRYRNPVKFYLY